MVFWIFLYYTNGTILKEELQTMKNFKKCGLVVLAALTMILGSMGVVGSFSEKADDVMIAGDRYPTIEIYSLPSDDEPSCSI